MLQQQQDTSSDRLPIPPEGRVNNLQITEEPRGKEVLLFCVRELVRMDPYASAERIADMINQGRDSLSRISGVEVLRAVVRSVHFLHVRTLIENRADSLDVSVEAIRNAPDVQLSARQRLILERESERQGQPVLS